MEPIRFLTYEAIRAIVYSVWTGPNCSIREGFSPRKMLHEKEMVPFSFLYEHFDRVSGPATFFLDYAITHKIKHLNVLDVARVYALEHITMVRAAELAFLNNGKDDLYFEKLKSRGYILNKIDLPKYLFSCVGKPGEIVGFSGGYATVQTRHCRLRGVVIPPEVNGTHVIVHFATAIASIPKKETEEIEKSQFENGWFGNLFKKLPDEIDYRYFLGRDLTHDTTLRIKML